MRIKIILASLLIACTSTCVFSQTKSKISAHNRAHREQLANQKRMDKSIVNDLIKHDVEARENHNDLSSQSSKMIDDMLKEAHRYIGRPYVHGAKGPKAFDCSGFSSYVYKQFGYTISPSSRAQFTQGVKVATGDLRKGDLVFFTSRSSGKNVGHVGIVVSADNSKGTFKFIHASIRGVKVSNFEGYYVPRYLGARRIIEH